MSERGPGAAVFTFSGPYEDVDALQPEDIAECVLFAVTRPAHVNIDELVVKTIDQSTAVRIHRH